MQVAKFLEEQYARNGKKTLAPTNFENCDLTRRLLIGLELYSHGKFLKEIHARMLWAMFYGVLMYPGIFNENMVAEMKDANIAPRLIRKRRSTWTKCLEK
jgi:hypothetical protein